MTGTANFIVKVVIHNTSMATTMYILIQDLSKRSDKNYCAACLFAKQLLNNLQIARGKFWNLNALKIEDIYDILHFTHSLVNLSENLRW